MQHPPKYYLGKFHADSIVHDTEALRLLTKVMGSDKVLPPPNTHTQTHTHLSLAASYASWRGARRCRESYGHAHAAVVVLAPPGC